MALNQQDVDYVRTLVYQQSAIVLEADKGYLVDARLTPVALSTGSPSVAHLVERLRTERMNGLHQRVVEALTTNETSFFRDIHPFEALRKTVLPELMPKRTIARRLNIWSAACSSGQEIYTIAMTLKQDFPSLAGWNIRLLATDLSSQMVARTRQGRFSQLEVNRGLPARFLPYFHREGVDWQVSDQLRGMVEATTMNLATPWPGSLPVMDVIFLRNVLIYFDVETKKRILRQARERLAPDGFLFLGGAESPLNLDDGYERLPIPQAGCYRLRQR